MYFMAEDLKNIDSWVIILELFDLFCKYLISLYTKIILMGTQTFI